MTDGKRDLEVASLDQRMEKVKCITYNFKLNQNNKEV